MTRVGIGYDSHRFVAGRPLILGGITIPHPQGLAGHSDADAVAHALTDAILGAAGAGNIGLLFPDSDPQWNRNCIKIPGSPGNTQGCLHSLNCPRPSNQPTNNCLTWWGIKCPQ